MKNFATISSHSGLAIAAENNRRCLTRAGIDVDTKAVDSVADIEAYLAAHPHLTNVVISALWIETADLQRLCGAHPKIQFCVCSHSNLAFLSADPNGTRLLREGIEMEKVQQNFHVAGNSHEFCEFVRKTFHVRCLWLPNLYFLDYQAPAQKEFDGKSLRVGCFGATRQQKNLLACVGVALEMRTLLGQIPTTVYINSGREEGNQGIVRAIQALCWGRVKLEFVKWASWAEFKVWVSQMDLLVSLSATESFSMVTADGVSLGVPSVVSNQIRWAPKRWKVPDTDDITHAAQVGCELVKDCTSAEDGFRSLWSWDDVGLGAWRTQLGLT